MKKLPVSLILALVLVSGCDNEGEIVDSGEPVADGAAGDGDGGGTPIPDGVTTYSLAGSVVDFETGVKVDGDAAVSASGLIPAPGRVLQGADFEFTSIPPGSILQLLAGAPPTHHSTYAGSFEIIDSDVTNIAAPAVGEEYLASLFAEFKVPLAAGSVLIAQLVDDKGSPLAGVAADVFQINSLDNNFEGPFFLDDNMKPKVELLETSASGYVVFFQVDKGLVAINAADGTGYTMTMTPSPVETTTVTLATVSTLVGEAPPAKPQNLSFKNDIVPIFAARACTACHSKKEIGNDLGGLSLDEKDVNKIYKEVVEEISEKHKVARVDLQNPANSLMLTQPSLEDPPDEHPNSTFRGETDPDYVKILTWIQEGAKNN